MNNYIYIIIYIIYHVCVQVRRCKCACACACMFILVYITAVKGRTHIEYVHIYIYIHAVCWNWGWNPVSCPKGNHLPDLLQPHLKAGGFSRWRLFWSHKGDSEVNPIINHPQLKKKTTPGWLGGFCGVGFVILVTFSTKKTLQRWWHPEPPFRMFRSLENGSQERRCTVLFQFQHSLRSLPIPGDEFAANSWKTPESIVQAPWLTMLLPSGNDVPQLLAFLPRAH